MRTSKNSVLAMAVATAAFTDLVQGRAVHDTWEVWGQYSANTTSGLLTGHAAPGYPLVAEYLGIPFAEPPIGELRFAAPVPYISKAQITADKARDSCVQSFPSRNTSLPQPAQNILAFSAISAVSEDCLYANVWAPQMSKASALKPVMIWIFGGGFHSGSATDQSQRPAIIVAEQDVVVVSFNYRLGVFGFPGIPGATQNPGLLDQRVAIEWVRDNVAAFGGDPERITLFGHSAGGASIDYYNYAWKDDPIVVGTIFLSGSSTTFGHRSAETGTQAWESLTQILGCNATSGLPAVDCARNAETSQVYNASLKAEATLAKTLSELDQEYIDITGFWSPTTDNEIVFANYSILGERGQFAKLPSLVGSNSDEGCLFSERGQISVSLDPILTEGVFTCPMNWAAIYRSSAGVPVWKYRWFGYYPNQAFSVCPGQPWHGQEINVLFGSTELISNQSATTNELEAGRYLRKAIAAFARDPSAGLMKEMQWPDFNANQSNLIALGLNNTDFAVIDATAIDAPCFTEFLFGGPDY